MVDIQSNILEKLRCSKCSGYLSYAPIMMTEDGGNLCGRCVNDNSNMKLIRNKAYEDFAAIAAFPCRYKESGCAVLMLWEDVIVHEDHCEYKPTGCPMAPQGTCKWKGPQCALLDHYNESHPEFILEHPCSLDTDVLVDNDKNMLLSFMDFIFLVQIRCNTAMSKLWHCVHCFAQPQIAQQFDFCVKFSSDDAGFEKKKRVLVEKCFKMQINKSVETNINMLLEFVGDSNNIKVVLSILPKVDSDLLNVFLCSECKDPALPAVFKSQNKYFCSNCKLESALLDRYKENLYGKVLKTCKNNSFGCPYFNNSKNLCKHEIWECKWQKKCFLDCETKFDHFVDKEHNSILQKHLAIDCWHSGQIKINVGMWENYANLLCRFLMKKAYIKVYIYSQLPKENIHLYKCVLQFNNNNGPKLTLKCTPTAEHDWELYETFLEKNPYIVVSSNKIYSYIYEISVSKEANL